jgi:hypothetical protein
MALTPTLHCVLFLGLLKHCQGYFESLRLFRQPGLHFWCHYMDVHSLHPYALHEGAQGAENFKRYTGMYYIPELSDRQLNRHVPLSLTRLLSNLMVLGLHSFAPL